jgi:hypothetical protein
VAGAVALATLLAGCGAVHLHDNDVSANDRRACKALVDDVPHRVSERPRRETKGGDLGAAWGDPAIVLTCGVGPPDGYQPTSPCQRVNGVDWFVPEDQISDQGKDVVLTTIGRKPRVEVVVPAEYRPPDATMVDLADAIKKHTKVVEPCS